MSHIITANYLRFEYYGKTREVYSSNPNFADVSRLLREGHVRQAVKAAAGALTPARVRKARNQDVRLQGNDVYFGNLKAPSTIAHIWGSTTDPIHRRAISLFMTKLAGNPSGQDSIAQLVRFIESNKMPLTTRGNVLVYKKVDSQYRDLHTHTMDNSPGRIITMQRRAVTANQHVACSHGLHVCSFGYLDRLGDGNILIMEVSPADVVSVPTDYRNSKVRCCRVLSLVRASDLLAAYDNRPPVDMLGSLLVFDPAILRKAWAMPGALQPTHDVSVGDPLAEAHDP